MLRVSDLNYSVDHTQILHNVSLYAAPGEFIGIIGPNGSGKSTLLKNIYKVLTPDSGKVEIQGKDLRSMSNREMARNLAVVAQEHEGSFDFLVEEVVLMGCQARKRLTEGFDETDREAVALALKKVELENFGQRSYLSLSGGEKQRVMIARALVQQTPIIILDEPTNHLDLGSQIKTLELLRGSGKTVIAALHDLSIAAKYCDRIYILQQGSNIAQGVPGEVITPELIRTLYHIEASVFRHDGVLYLHYH